MLFEKRVHNVNYWSLKDRMMRNFLYGVFFFICFFIKPVFTGHSCVSFEAFLKEHQCNFIPLPKIIWQTYKTKILPVSCQRCQKSWQVYNPEYAIYLFDDADIETYIKTHWDKRMLDFFYALPLGVMKADLWRYLILATEGGIYADLDAKSCRPIDFWPVGDIKLSEQNNYLLIGLENEHHFCQWTIAATKNHPAMQFICDYILTHFEKNGINIKDPCFVHATTGPGIWTEAICAYLEEKEGGSSLEIYQKYVIDPSYRAFVNAKGIYLYNEKFYAGICARNLYGSQHFGDGYVRWIDAAEKLQKEK